MTPPRSGGQRVSVWRSSLVAGLRFTLVHSRLAQGGTMNKPWWVIRNQIARTISTSSSTTVPEAPGGRRRFWLERTTDSVSCTGWKETKKLWRGTP